MSGFDKESFDAWVMEQAVPGMAEAGRAADIMCRILGCSGFRDSYLFYSMGVTAGLKLFEKMIVEGEELNKEQFAAHVLDAFMLALQEADEEGDENVD